MSDLTDADIIRGKLDSTLFPGISSSITVHEGFRNEQKKYDTPCIMCFVPAEVLLVTGPHRTFSPL